jgi:hypothetical protein
MAFFTSSDLVVEALWQGPSIVRMGHAVTVGPLTGKPERMLGMTSENAEALDWIDGPWTRRGDSTL